MSIDVALRALRYILPLIAAAIALTSLLKKSTNDNAKAKRTLRWSIFFVTVALAGTWAIQFLDDVRQEEAVKLNSSEIMNCSNR